MAKLKKQHMTIHWKAIVQDDARIPATEATLKEKATLVGRVGLLMLSVGTSAWRVRNSMNNGVQMPWADLLRRYWTTVHFIHLH